MLPTSFLNLIKSLNSQVNYSSTSLLIICLVTLSSCKVPLSFGYALGGTFAVMLVGLVIATFVTSRNKKGDRDEH
jgi:hypothetical protein